MSDVDQIVDMLLEQEPDDEARDIFATAPVKQKAIDSNVLQYLRKQS